jgi:hypothetical protein
MVCLLLIKPFYFLRILLLHQAVATPLAFGEFAPDEAHHEIALHQLSLMAMLQWAPCWRLDVVPTFAC